MLYWGETWNWGYPTASFPRTRGLTHTRICMCFLPFPHYFFWGMGLHFSQFFLVLQGSLCWVEERGLKVAEARSGRSWGGSITLCRSYLCSFLLLCFMHWERAPLVLTSAESLWNRLETGGGRRVGVFQLNDLSSLTPTFLIVDLGLRPLSSGFCDLSACRPTSPARETLNSRQVRGTGFCN